MKKIILFFTLLSTFAYAAEIHNRDVMDSSYIKIMNTGDNQYSFALCEESVCSWIGKKDSYSKQEIASTIKRLKIRTTVYFMGEGAILTAATIAACYAAGALGIGSLLHSVEMNTLKALITGVSAVILAAGVPTAGLITASKVDILNPTYPRKLAKALQATFEGKENVHIKVENMNYIGKLLATVLER